MMSYEKVRDKISTLERELKIMSDILADFKRLSDHIKGEEANEEFIYSVAYWTKAIESKAHRISALTEVVEGE